MKAFLNNARISPKKMNLIAGLVRGQKAQEALDRLRLTPKKAAQMLRKVVVSALANANNNFDQKTEDLYIKSIIVNKGVTLKRGIPISRGRYHPILKRNSNITVEIGVTAGAEGKKKSTKAESTGAETTLPEKATVEKKTKTTKKTAVKASSKKKTAEKTTSQEPQES